MPFIGMGAMAVSIGVPLAYRAMESANLVPPKVSLCVEKYMPSISNASLLITGGPFSRILSFVALSGAIPGASDYVQRKID